MWWSWKGRCSRSSPRWPSYTGIAPVFIDILDILLFLLDVLLTDLLNSSLDSLALTDVFAGPEPEFEESLRKVMAKVIAKKKGQCTLDGWATATAAKAEKKDSKEPKEAKVAKVTSCL